MVLGFWMMLLMAVASNAQLERTPSTSSPVPGGTGCPESRLSAMEDQLNRMMRIVSTLNDPLIKEGCTADLASYGWDDSPKHGHIKTSGGSLDEVLVAWQLSKYRGVTLMELDATTCITKNRQTFDTYGNAADRSRMLETLESATTGTVIVGVTADSPEQYGDFSNHLGTFFTKYCMDLTGLKERGKFAFIMQKGYPQKTKFQKMPRYGPSVQLKVALVGSTVSNVTFVEP